MTIPVKLRRSGTTTATPSSLEYGELAINYADGVVFYRDSSDVIQSFTLQAYALSSHTHAASDITSGTLDAARIANDSITYAKIQNVSTTDRLLGRSSAGAGDVEEVTCTAFGRSLIDDADAAAARTTLGAAPTASPAFTGAATVANDGNVVPLTVTNTGTANSFVVNDASGDTSPFVVDASGNVGIGTSSPGYKLDVVGNGKISSDLQINTGRTISGGSGGAFISSTGINADFVSTGRAAAITGGWGTVRIHQVAGYAGLRLIGDTSQTAAYMDVENSSGTTLVSINSSGQLLVTAGSGSAGSYKPGIAVSGDDDTGIAQVGASPANTLSIITNGSERVRVDASGNVGIGGAPTQKLDVAGADAAVSVGTGSYGRVQLSGGNALGYLYGSFPAFGDGIHLGYNYYANAAGTGVVANSSGETSRITAGYGFVAIATSSAVNTAPTERMRVNAAGELLIGTTTDNGAYLLQVNSQIYATNATIATSDARFKTRVESLADATSVIESLRPVAFDFIPQTDRNFATERQVGLIAQEAQAALAGTDYADSVVAQCGDHLGLAYEKLVPVLVKALQESNARIAALEERLNHA